MSWSVASARRPPACSPSGLQSISPCRGYELADTERASAGTTSTFGANDRLAARRHRQTALQADRSAPVDVHDRPHFDGSGAGVRNARGPGDGGVERLRLDQKVSGEELICAR